ncbi:hypothetical protein F442_14610 [Phytophthora nicotianae P10297]|uniref:Uncharacterized protein n=1 Tax=Phytophthora nicotianae P10297 TaxID=1317064 RepID=W2YSE4_PHYNI|nr:hypothetical protein F442_14610 [Phytophthora nicotianae P10297]
MEELRAKFHNDDLRLFDGDLDEWLNLARVNAIYRVRVRGTTQVMLVKKYLLNHRVVVRRGDNTGQVLDLLLVDDQGEENPEFNSATMAVYVKLIDIYNIDKLLSLMLNPRKTKKRQKAKLRSVVARLTEESDVRTVMPDKKQSLQSAGEWKAEIDDYDDHADDVEAFAFRPIASTESANTIASTESANTIASTVSASTIANTCTESASTIDSSPPVFSLA